MSVRALLPAIVLLVLLLAGCTAPAGGREWTVTPPSPSATPTNLTAWVNIQDQPDWQANMLVDSAAALNAAGGNVTLSVSGEPLEGGAYHDRIAAAAARGDAPDIVYFDNSERMMAWSEAGYLWPLDDCRRAHPSLAGILDGAWDMATFQGRTWAVPNGLNAYVLFFNKPLLRELGWPAERVAALPDDIRDGRFTFADLSATAAKAVEAGVVSPGYGYWHIMGHRRTIYYHALGARSYDPQAGTLVLNRAALVDVYHLVRQLANDRISLPFILDSRRNTWSGRVAWHDAVIHDRVLFWLARSADWTRWTNSVADPERLGVRFGFALFPTLAPGGVGMSFANLSGFAVMSPEATGREHQATACALLAQTVAPGIAANAMTISRLPVIEDDIAPDMRLMSTFTTGAEYMIEPGLAGAPPNDLRYNEYSLLINQISDRVLFGELTPEKAADLAIEQLRATFGDGLVIE